MKPDDLPPLHLLLAFEAAGTLGSFKSAAAKLHVTPSAISHQIKELESALGIELFARHGRSVGLTRAGSDYLREIQRALAIIASATRRVQHPTERRVLRLSTDNFIAYEFLLPQLACFRTRFPNVELSLVPTTQIVDLATAPVDAAIRIGQGPWPGLVAHALGDTWVTPVCSPRLAPEIASLADLSAHPLIEVRGQRRGWRDFLRRRGTHEDREPLYFDGYLETMRAAEQGLGVAFGVFPMTTSWVLDGRLATPLSIRSPLSGEICFVYREAEVEDPLYMEVATWLLERYAALPAWPAARRDAQASGAMEMPARRCSM